MDNVHNTCPRNFVAVGDQLKVYFLVQCYRRGNGILPKPEPLAWARQRKMNHGLKTPQECVVDVFAKVGRENNQPVVSLHPLQQVGDFLVGVAVVRIPYAGAFAEETGFIK